MNRLRSQIHKHVFIDIFVTILGFFLIIAWISLKEFNLCFRICASLLVLAVLFRIKFYILKDSKIVTLLRKKQIKYNDVKTIVFTLSYNDTGQLYTIPGLNSKMDFDVVVEHLKKMVKKDIRLLFAFIYLKLN